MLLILLLSVGLCFYWQWEIGDGYYKNADKIYFENKLVTEHVDSFELIDKSFAKNKNLVFYLGKDFSTDVDFQKFLNNNFLATTKSIYYYTDKGINRIRSINGRTFEFIENNYGKDKDLYYFIDPDGNSKFTCVQPKFINNNEEYDIQCDDSLFKQGQFVKYTEQYQKRLETEEKRKAFDEANKPKSNRDLLEDLFGRELEMYEFEMLNISNAFCDKTIEEAVDNKTTFSRYGGLQINDKEFSANYSCSKFNKECDNIDIERSRVMEETADNTYNIVNGCLYKKSESVFEHNLLIKRMLGYFNNNKNDNIGQTWEGIKESHRFEKNGNMYIYLSGYASCGGCVFNGPFLVINLTTDNVSGGNSNIPYLPNLFYSPDNSKAIEAAFDKDKEKSEIKLFLYDFLKDERVKLIYTVPDNKTILSVGDGTYPIKDSIKWLDENQIQIQQYKRSEEKWTEVVAIYEKKDGRSYFTGYENPDKPVIVKINK